MNKRRIFPYILLFSFILSLSGCFQLNTDYNYKIEEYKTRKNITKIIVDDNNVDVLLNTKEGNDISIEYKKKPKEDPYKISIKDEILKIEKLKIKKEIENQNLIIYLPKKEYEEIIVHIKNGDIVSREINSYIYNSKTDNGDIVFKNSKSHIFHSMTNNGDIYGNIMGNPDEYLRFISIENGNSNLKNNMIESDKLIDFSLANGDININFIY